MATRIPKPAPEAPGENRIVNDFDHHSLKNTPSANQRSPRDILRTSIIVYGDLLSLLDEDDWDAARESSREHRHFFLAGDGLSCR